MLPRSTRSVQFRCVWHIISPKFHFPTPGVVASNGRVPSGPSGGELGLVESMMMALCLRHYVQPGSVYRNAVENNKPSCLCCPPTATSSVRSHASVCENCHWNRKQTGAGRVSWNMASEHPCWVGWMTGRSIWVDGDGAGNRITFLIAASNLRCVQCVQKILFLWHSISLHKFKVPFSIDCGTCTRKEIGNARNIIEYIDLYL